MKRLAPILAVIGLLAVLSGCGDSHESLASENVAILKQLNGILDAVKDEASAKDARTKFESSRAKLEGIKQRADALGKASKGTKADVERQFNAEKRANIDKLFGHMERINKDPKLAGPLKESLEKLRTDITSM
jgi:hypothetical protein